jgi:hypothetical protein
VCFMCKFNSFSPGQKAIHVGITRGFMKTPGFRPSLDGSFTFGSSTHGNGELLFKTVRIDRNPQFAIWREGVEGRYIAPPPKNVERGIYEYVDHEKVLYFLRLQLDNR